MASRNVKQLCLFAATALASIFIFIDRPMAETRARHSLAPLTVEELSIQRRIEAHVRVLAGDIGGRNAVNVDGLKKAAGYIEAQLRSFGFIPRSQPFSFAGQTFENIEAEKQGSRNPKEMVVVGAHYDTAGDLPGANDNASGVAACLELARLFAGKNHGRTLRWLLFTNEEPPSFQTHGMGSYVYAKRCRERSDDIVVMLSLETIGYYSDVPGSQSYPVGFHPGYPDRGDFLGFVADIKSAPLLRSALKSFRGATSLPAEGAAAPAFIPGIGWSDHWSFWQFGYRALMLTDTAPYRYPHYHAAEDTPDKLDYERLTRAFTGIAAVVADLVDK